jgi:hypothetical protein
MTTFYCLRFETPPTWRIRSPYLYPPGTWKASYTPRHSIPFSSPPMTRRATVSKIKSKSLCDWWSVILSRCWVPIWGSWPDIRAMVELSSLYNLGTDRTGNFSSLLHVLSLPGKQRVHKAVPQQRLLYCRLSTQLLLGNGSTCHSINTRFYGFNKTSAFLVMLQRWEVRQLMFKMV